MSTHSDSPQPASQPAAGQKKPYAKPQVLSHQVFEASMACIKVPGNTACGLSFRHSKS